MKFKTLEDTFLFLIDIGKPHLISKVDENYQPSKEELNEFIKKRNTLIGKLKDFRKSQISKSNWRKYRPEIMRGIKAFHKSTKGKRFHRNLGRFLVSRISNEDMSGYDLAEGMKALSSTRTHLYIEKEYYKPLYEQVLFDTLADEMNYQFTLCELKFLENKEIEPYEMNLMLEVVDTEILADEISIKTTIEKESVLKEIDRENIDLLEIVTRLLKNKRK